MTGSLMARCLLKNVFPILQTGKLQCLEFTRKNCMKNHSFTFCVFRYISCLRQRAVHILDPNKQSEPLHVPCNETVRINSSLEKAVNRAFSCTLHTSHSQSTGVSAVLSKSKKKPAKPKSSVKEFTIKGKTGDHDLSIKLAKIQGLLEKGKTIEIFVKHNSTENAEQNSTYVSGIEKKLRDNLKILTKLRKDYSNEHTTKFTLVPSIIGEDEKLIIGENKKSNS